MKMRRINIAVLDERGTVIKHRTAFEHNAEDVVKAWQEEYAPGGHSFRDRDGDHIILTAEAWALREASTPAQQPSSSSASRRRR